MRTQNYSLTVVPHALSAGEVRVSTIHWTPPRSQYTFFSDFEELPVLLAKSSYRVLSFDKNMTLDAADCEKIFAVLPKMPIQELNFCPERKCGSALLSLENFDSFSKLKDTNVKVLRLRDNKISQLSSLCEALKDVPFEVLDLSENNISSAAELMNLDKLPKTLHTIKLANNRLNEDGARTLLQFIRRHPNITHADIRGYGRISDEIIADINAQLEINRSRVRVKSDVKGVLAASMEIVEGRKVKFANTVDIAGSTIEKETEDLLARIRREREARETKWTQEAARRARNEEMEKILTSTRQRHNSLPSLPGGVRHAELIGNTDSFTPTPTVRMDIVAGSSKQISWKQIVEAGEEFNATGLLSAAIRKLIPPSGARGF